MVILEGKEKSYRLLISFNAQCDIEEHTKESVFETMNKPATMNILRTIFAIGLRYGEKEKFSFVEAGDIISDILETQGYQYFEAKVQEALIKGLGIDEALLTNGEEAGETGKK